MVNESNRDEIEEELMLKKKELEVENDEDLKIESTTFNNETNN